MRCRPGALALFTLLLLLCRFDVMASERAPSTLAIAQSADRASQIDTLQRSIDLARKMSDRELEDQSIRRLKLITDSSPAWSLYYIRMLNARGGKDRESTKKLTDDLCRAYPSSFECSQAKASYEVTSPAMRLKLQSFYMHETNSQFDEAVADLKKIFGKSGPLEEDLRWRYFNAMSQTPNMAQTAVAGFEKMLEDDPFDLRLRERTFKVINSVKAQIAAEHGISLINADRTADGQKLLAMALKTDPDNPDADYWKKRLTMSKGSLYMQRADMLLAKKRWSDAAAYYKKASSFIPDDPYPYSGLSRAFYGLGDLRSALLNMKKAHSLSKNESLSEQRRFGDAVRALEAEIFKNEAGARSQKNDHEGAITLYRKAIDINSQDPWLRYSLASELVALNENDEALLCFDGLKPSDEEAHARSLILERTGDLKGAVSALAPYTAENKALRERARSLITTIRENEADLLLKEGKAYEALLALGSPDDARGLLLKASILEALSKNDEAFEALSATYDKDKDSDTLYRMFENRLNARDPKKALSLASDLFAKRSDLAPWQLRSLASGMLELGLNDKSLSIYDALYKAIGRSGDDRDGDSMTARTYLELHEKDLDKATLERGYNKAIARWHGVKPYPDAYAYTKALRTPDRAENWLITSLRSRASSLYLRNTPILTSGFAYTRDSGHNGYSNLKSGLFINNFSFPLLNGRAHIQTETRDLNEGRLSGGQWDDMFGSCFSTGCALYGGGRQRATRTLVDIGYTDGIARFDIGTAPKLSGSGLSMRGLQFSLSSKFTSGDFSLGAEIYRRPVTSSLLSYYGQYDKRSSHYYGAVHRTGILLSPGYSKDGASGFWGSLSFERYQGYNVKSNNAIKIIGGWYKDLFTKPNSDLSLGISGSWWRFREDLSDYTIGKGGYYSPQDSFALGPSLDYRFRNTYWSVELRSSISLSWSRTKAADRYPKKGLTYAQSEYNVATGETGYPSDLNSGSSTSAGFNLNLGLSAIAERRLSSRLVAGGSASFSHTRDYHPAVFMVYLRAYFRPWNGDLPMGPQAPSDTASW